MRLVWAEDISVTTTVGELVAELQKFDQTSPVYTEGDDCIGNVIKVSLLSDGSVLIERDDYALCLDEEIGSVDYHKWVVAGRYTDRIDAPTWEEHLKLIGKEG